MSTITVEITIKVKSKFTSSNAERPNGLISPQMSEIFTPLQDATLGVASARRAIGFL
jgi:hypothetical protein